MPVQVSVKLCDVSSRFAHHKSTVRHASLGTLFVNHRLQPPQRFDNSSTPICHLPDSLICHSTNSQKKSKKAERTTHVVTICKPLMTMRLAPSRLLNKQYGN
jgi:hypothetical protein